MGLVSWMTPELVPGRGHPRSHVTLLMLVLDLRMRGTGMFSVEALPLAVSKDEIEQMLH